MALLQWVKGVEAMSSGVKTSCRSFLHSAVALTLNPPGIDEVEATATHYHLAELHLD